jgi:catechol 2,3-dioxygenase-like lactoylglutathione lyase family enzyme
MLDHIGLGISDFAAGKRFFLAALAPLGGAAMMEFPDAVGIGRDGKPTFWLAAGDKPAAPMHIAFAARSRREVDEFYRAALAAGGKDNGPPGVREHYHPTYYAAFVIGPDGHNVEAVCHAPA